MTGLALTTAGIAATPAADAAERTLTSTEDRPGQLDRPSSDSHRDEGKPDDTATSRDKSKKQIKRSKGVPVPCGADKLIAAITLANARGGTVLDLAKKCTYLLTADIDDGNGLPTITAPITLNGGKHTTITRAAGVEQFRIVTVGTGGDLTLNHLKITGGQTDGDGGAILVNPGGALTTNHSKVVRNIAGDSGGGIVNNGIASVEHSTVGRNTAVFGGGIFNRGQLTLKKSRVGMNNGGEGAGIFSLGSTNVTHSDITRNQASDAGGGLFMTSGTHTFTRTHIAKNTAPQAGGFLVNAPGQVTFRKVLLADNAATSQLGGGAVVSSDALFVANDSTIKNNTTATDGGGLSNSGEIVLRRTKVIGNQASGLGGGIENEASGTLTLFGTKVTNNLAATDGGGIFNNGGTVVLNTATGTVVVKNRPNNCAGVPGCPG
ncbi:hypothetical protein Sar04_09570 [Salinispora arenicola]|uniref:Polymorphic outer membrane protein n=1 Tax=Salinispora arenicola TaxID=168697 RepID=A0ABQ4JQ70_SALAC|nr:hypothetical protein Sar04_09570 [Salinispora arenicola]